MKKNRTLGILLMVGLLLVALLAYFKQPKGDFSRRPLANFAIDDTASITKIFIVDTDQRAITLKRNPASRYWDLNDTLKARKDAVDLLLKTFKRIKVKAPVPKAAQENVIRLLAGAGKKVEIYQGGKSPVKTYIVGNATQDHTGTYMLLETNEGGRSTEPFIMHMEGFTGFLSTRFFTDLDEWRYTGLFDYPRLEFSKVEAVHHLTPFHSFTVTYRGGNDLKLFDYRGEAVDAFDTVAVKDFLILFKKAHIETYRSHLLPEQEDSLLNSQPAFTFRVHENSGGVREVTFYRKPKVIDIPDEYDNIEPYDMARMYAEINGEVGLAQLFVFEPMVKTRLSDFIQLD
jgi:hypothetical protein